MNIVNIDGYKGLINLKNDKVIDTNKDKNTFGNLLNDALNQVNQLQIDSQEYKEELAMGEIDNLHDVTIAADKANTALQVVMGIRNKVVEAYREIMRIQI